MDSIQRIRAAILSLFLVVSLASPVDADNEILIGLIPEENIFKQMDRHRPLADYLSEKLGVKVKMTILSRYGDVIDRFVSRKMDGAFFGGFTGVLAMEKLGVEPVVKPVYADGSSVVQSYIIARKDSGIRSVKDMRGKGIAFVDRATVTGYIGALAYFRKNGVADPGSYFSEQQFTGSHDAVIHAVLDNRADVGVVKSKVFKRFIEKDPVISQEIAVIADAGSFPDSILCLRKGFPDDLKAMLKKNLLQMEHDAAGRGVLQKMEINKFVESDKKDFQVFFTVADKAGINLRSYRYK